MSQKPVSVIGDCIAKDATIACCPIHNAAPPAIESTGGQTHVTAMVDKVPRAMTQSLDICRQVPFSGLSPGILGSLGHSNPSTYSAYCGRTGLVVLNIELNSRNKALA